MIHHSRGWNEKKIILLKGRPYLIAHKLVLVENLDQRDILFCHKTLNILALMS